MLSARSEKCAPRLRGEPERLAKEHAEANGSSPVLPDLTYTLGARRNHHPHRLTLVASQLAELTEELDAFAKKRTSLKVAPAFTPRPEQAPRIGFRHERPRAAMVGNGPRTDAARAGLSRAIERCDAAMRAMGALFASRRTRSLRKRRRQMHRTEIAQPAIFAMQVALAELWKSWGVQPAAIVGHSVGEIAAACVAGIFRLKKRRGSSRLRAPFMEGCARGEGTMLAVGLARGRSARAYRAARPHGYDRRLQRSAFAHPRRPASLA